MYFENVSRRNVVPIICERVGRGKYSNSHFLFMDCGKREKVNQEFPITCAVETFYCT